MTLQLYQDVNGNGMIDGGDVIIATQNTNGSGNYLFLGVPAGTYIVNVVDASVSGRREPSRRWT